jgi:hypothetical protein
MTPNPNVNALIFALSLAGIILLVVFWVSSKPDANRTIIDTHDARCKHQWEKCGTVFHHCGTEVLAGRTYRIEQFCYKEVCTKCGCRARLAADKPERWEIF